MSSSFDFTDLRSFTTGTVGEPGDRVFYLQLQSGFEVATLRLEKVQVAALAEYLAAMMADLPSPDPADIADAGGLVEPVVAEWVVGQMGVVFDEERDRVVIRADEVAVTDEEGSPVEDFEGAKAVFAVTRAQTAAFVVRAAEVVNAGRPPCRWCGRPIDAEGHSCAKTNGHR